jgi:NAD(P)H-hydrate repair Nnr-like enzyme with NAD(P)H-hydrate epimerase domain
MSLLVRTGALAVLAFAAFAAVGCGETVIDDAKTEAAIEQNLEKSVGQKVTSVDCPSGVEVEAGATFDCSVALAGGREETATLKILNEDADVEVTDLKPDK